ncbi:TIGR02117 family protein [Flavobacterium sp. 3HN19-14]|uniref:TIGR02117 family protein n=1 Tax=Flavobacterium sp. 3HN19-14 TaxID=3448133 RepID=UPI003EDFC9C4
MRFFKKLLKIIGRTALVLTGIILIYLLSAYTLSRITVNSDIKAVDEIAIFIKTNGVHTDIIVPAKGEIIDWTKEIKFDQTIAKDATAQYLAFGWGDRGFYLNTPQWSDLKASTAFTAAFYLGTSVMHTQFYNNLSESESCKKIMISRADYQKLVDYISQSFYRDPSGNIVWIQGSSYGNHDAFYEANGKYSLFKTCNSWANAALKSANQKAALWTATDTGIFCHYN